MEEGKKGAKRKEINKEKNKGKKQRKRTKNGQSLPFCVTGSRSSPETRENEDEK